jgi:hypothetical protein
MCHYVYIPSTCKELKGSVKTAFISLVEYRPNNLLLVGIISNLTIPRHDGVKTKDLQLLKLDKTIKFFSMNITEIYIHGVS